MLQYILLSDFVGKVYYLQNNSVTLFTNNIDY